MKLLWKHKWVLFYVRIILTDFGQAQEPLSISNETEVVCNSEWGSVKSGKHRLMVQECIVFFCQEFNATNAILKKIPCKDYLNYVFPDKFPDNAKQIYRVLCKSCIQTVLGQQFSFK